MIKKKFKDLINNKVVEVTDQFEDIVILDNKSKIKINQLLDKRIFEEYVDPNSFFKNETLLNSFAQQIKQIPLDDWKNRVSSEEGGYEDSFKNNSEPKDLAVLPYDPEIEKQEILDKYKSLYKQNPSASLMNKQIDSLQNILDDPEELRQQDDLNEESQHPNTSIIKDNIKKQIKMDPILEMFKNVKRNTNFRIDFTVENKIPRIDFIEMMEDSYNTSIIEFLAQEFTDEILKDPNLIKDKIKNKLMDLVYPDVENKKVTDD
jgi:hypothetical protein